MRCSSVIRPKKRVARRFTWLQRHWYTIISHFPVTFGRWDAFYTSYARCMQLLISLKWVPMILIPSISPFTFSFHFQSMDDLIRCILTKNYPPIDTALYPYSNQLVSLCDDMMRVEVPKRATIKHIISNPLILVDYYHSYFRFDAWFQFIFLWLILVCLLMTQFWCWHQLMQL